MQWSHYAFIYCSHCNYSFTRTDSNTSFNDIPKERIYAKKKNPTDVSHKLTFYWKFLERETENINNGFSKKTCLFVFFNLCHVSNLHITLKGGIVKDGVVLLSPDIGSSCFIAWDQIS